MTCSSVKVVKIMTAVSGYCSVTIRQTSIPLTPGSRTSSNATSGRKRSIRISASSALAARPTMEKSGSVTNIAFSPSRTISWSSIIIKRIIKVPSPLRLSRPLHHLPEQIDLRVPQGGYAYPLARDVSYCSDRFEEPAERGQCHCPVPQGWPVHWLPVRSQSQSLLAHDAAHWRALPGQ